MKHVVSFSGGVGSWAAAKRVAQQYGINNMVLLFADVMDEDPDLYRFLDEAARNVGVPITRIADGRSPKQLMWDESFIGNSRLDPCSRILKRELIDRWLKANCDPADTTRYIGIDWTEVNRYTRWAARISPWIGRAPLCEEPYLSKNDVFKLLASEGIAAPALYAEGFTHNNCGGACIKAGQGQWKRLLKKRPATYFEWEEWEEDMRVIVGDHSILRDRSGGGSKPLTLKNFRLKVERDEPVDDFEIGGCGCALE